MMTRYIRMILGLFLVTTVIGCSMDGVDPLLFDDSGQLRPSVHRYEVEEAEIDEGCEDFTDALEGEAEEVRVPIEGGEGEPVLVGVGGQALCIDTGDDTEHDDEENNLEGIHITGTAGPDGNSAIGTTSTDDELEAGPPETQSGGQFTNQTVIEDPTPEPASD